MNRAHERAEKSQISKAKSKKTPTGQLTVMIVPELEFLIFRFFGV